jgi:hypothetical protein
VRRPGGGFTLSSDKSAICLIRPPAVESFRFATTSITLPLGLAYISAALKAAPFHTHVIDAVGEAPEVRTLYTKGHLVGTRPELHRTNVIAALTRDHVTARSIASAPLRA